MLTFLFSGMKKEGGEEGGEDGKEPEYKFEWQRTWGHAPKESYLEKGDDFNEQPFGIQVGLIGWLIGWPTDWSTYIDRLINGLIDWLDKNFWTKLIDLGRLYK